MFKGILLQKKLVYVDFSGCADTRKISMSVLVEILRKQDELESKGIILQRQIETIIVEGCANTIPSLYKCTVGNLKVGERIRIGDFKDR